MNLPSSPSARAAGVSHPRAKRVALGIATWVVSVNIWTGAPVAALWVGSRLQGDGGLSMGTVFGMIAALALLVGGLAWLLGWLSASYDHVLQRSPGARRTSPWLRSVRGEREDRETRRRQLGDMERILVITVVLAVVAFEGWFFLVAGSPLPKGT